jgi:5-aminopentanamidase
MSSRSLHSTHNPKRKIALAVHQSAPRSSIAASVQQVIDAVHQFRVELDAAHAASVVGLASSPPTSVPAMMLFAELFLGGYGSGDLLIAENTTISPPVGCPMESIPTDQVSYHGSQWLEPIRRACRDNHVGVVCGYSERAENAALFQPSNIPASEDTKVLAVTSKTADPHFTYFNAAFVIDDDGVVLASYRKVHLWGAYEASYFTPLNNLLGGRFMFHGIPCGVLICFDVEFPESTRTLRLDGAEIVFVPTALVNAFNARVTVPSRAFENNFVVCYANEIGQDPVLEDVTYCGLSVVALTDGTEGCRSSAFSDICAASPAAHGAAQLPLLRQRKFDYCVIDIVDPAFANARTRNNYLEARRPNCYRNE